MRTLNVSDNYMPMLSFLSNDSKMDIIVKLTSMVKDSMKEKVSKPDIRTCFSKEWDKNKSATEVADELRNSRCFTDRITEW